MARFNVQEEIEGDSFGKFERCTDNGDNGKPVYVKSYRIEDVGLGVPISLICQISLLKQMDHPRITRLQVVLISITASRVYQVFEYAGPNLKDFLKNSPETARNRQLTKSFMHQILTGISHCQSNNSAHGFLTPYQTFMHQILTGIYYYHSNNFVHGFLTPYQLLIDIKNNRLKVAHVGMAVTPSFKAPEIMLGFKNYSFPADVWSIGCIFAEMVLLKPLFGSADEFHERGRIFSFMGTPNDETMPGVTAAYEYLHCFTKHEPKDLSPIFRDHLEPAGFDLLMRMLCMNPRKRITVDEALRHEYFQNVYIPDQK